MPESWLDRAVVVPVVNTLIEYRHAAYVGTLAGMDRGANGSIEGTLVTECTAGTTQCIFHDDNVLVWSAVIRLSLPGPGFLPG